ncbi:DUF2237 domain-containing [Brachionus plicatilis]|uniref:DUF2237 domain-containing n=1 Tax=Brachionus plicatilis TaxID=10195 RepID=A0A3M7SH14_BRAPC|nr:DUF2237 domain-containing [Brachionus plicatilis]
MKFKFFCFLFAIYIAIGNCKDQKNVNNEPLEVCSLSPMTGYTRTGKCETNEWDQGTHLVCARVNDKFLKYTKAKGNDLSTPRSWFPGLKDGDNWCLCVFRWVQAYRDGFGPSVVLNATNKEALNYLKQFGVGLKDISKN